MAHTRHSVIDAFNETATFDSREIPGPMRHSGLATVAQMIADQLDADEQIAFALIDPRGDNGPINRFSYVVVTDRVIIGGGSKLSGSSEEPRVENNQWIRSRQSIKELRISNTQMPRDNGAQGGEWASYSRPTVIFNDGTERDLLLGIEWVEERQVNDLIRNLSQGL